MTVWVFVCDEEEAAIVARTLGFPLQGSPAVVSRAEPNKADRKEMRRLAGAVCAALHIDPADSHLVHLLGGKAGMTNLDAAIRWCSGSLDHTQEDSPPTNAVDVLTTRLQKHLLNKMH